MLGFKVFYSTGDFFFFFLFRPHSSLNNFSPFEVHHNPHISSKIARLTSGKIKERWRAASHPSIFQNKLSIGDKVLLKNKRETFKKQSAIFYPNFKEKVYEIDGIDRKTIPFLYSLKDQPRRKYYHFEVQKLGHSWTSNPKTFSNQAKVIVKNVEVIHPSTLRSGKALKNKGDIVYTIERNGESDRVPPRTLKIFKKMYGANSIIYDSLFDNADKQIYKV